MTRLVAFDFDGTVTRRDTLIPFLVEVRGLRPVLACLGRRGLPIAASLGGIGSRDHEKARLLSRLLAGVPLVAAEAAGTAVAHRLVEERGLRPDVVGTLRAHVAAGDTVVVVSASPELVVRPVMGTFGVDHLLTTQLAVEDGVLTGALVGPNVRGAEKVRRLVELLPGPWERTIAYGDSRGDAALLAWADEAHRV